VKNSKITKKLKNVDFARIICLEEIMLNTVISRNVKTSDRRVVKKYMAVVMPATDSLGKKDACLV
jgi:hypothetical protein